MTVTAACKMCRTKTEISVDPLIVKDVITNYICRECLHKPGVQYSGFTTPGLVSSKGPRLSLLTYHFLCRVAERCEEGIKRKGEDKAWNNLCSREIWNTGITDLDGAIERCSHIMNHAARLIDKLKAAKEFNGVFQMEDDDAGAIGWGSMYLCEVTKAIGPKEEK